VRLVYLPAGNWIDFWTNQSHAGGKNINWTNHQQTQMPLFVREGAIIPMLLNDVETLCETNYVNNPGIKTPDNGLQFWIYPSPKSQFTVYDGTNIQCDIAGSKVTVTVSSDARSVLLRVLGKEPVAVTRDGATIPKLGTPGQFDAAVMGWRADSQAGLVFIKFERSGGLAHIDF